MPGDKPPGLVKGSISEDTNCHCKAGEDRIPGFPAPVFTTLCEKSVSVLHPRLNLPAKRRKHPEGCS